MPTSKSRKQDLNTSKAVAGILWRSQFWDCWAECRHGVGGLCANPTCWASTGADSPATRKVHQVSCQVMLICAGKTAWQLIRVCLPAVFSARRRTRGLAGLRTITGRGRPLGTRGAGREGMGVWGCLCRRPGLAARLGHVGVSPTVRRCCLGCGAGWGLSGESWAVAEDSGGKARLGGPPGVRLRKGKAQGTGWGGVRWSSGNAAQRPQRARHPPSWRKVLDWRQIYGWSVFTEFLFEGRDPENKLLD